MPTVPVYDQRRVEAAPIPGARLTTQADPQAFGQGIGQAAQHVGQTLGGVHLQELEKANQVRMLDFDAQVSQFENDHVYGKALRTEGKDSFGIREQFDKDWQGLSDSLNQQVANDQQRAALQKMLTERKIGNDRMLIRHMDAEGRKYDDESLRATISSSVNRAAMAADPGAMMVPGTTRDPGVDLEVAKQEKLLAEYGARRGMPPEWVKAQIEQHRTATYAGVIDRLLANDQDRQAAVYLEKYRPDISGPELTRIEKAVEVGTFRGEAQRSADEIVSRAENLKEATAMARGLDPKMRDEVQGRIEHHFALEDKAKAAERDAAYEQADSIVNSGKGIGTIPMDVWTKLDGVRQRNLEVRAKQVDEGIEPATKFQVWMDFYSKTPAEMAAMSKADIQSMRPHLDNKDFERAVSMWNSARSAAAGNKDAQEKHSNTLSNKDIIENAARLSGLIDKQKPLNKLTEDQATMFMTFESNVAAAIARKERQTGRPLAEDEVKAVVGQMLSDKVTIKRPTWMFGLMGGGSTEKPAAAATPEELKSAVPVARMPDFFAFRVKSTAKSLGYTVNDEKIRRIYAASLAGASDDAIKAIMAE
jgi:hypothetical protein